MIGVHGLEHVRDELLDLRRDFFNTLTFFRSTGWQILQLEESLNNLKNNRQGTKHQENFVTWLLVVD